MDSRYHNKICNDSIIYKHTNTSYYRSGKTVNAPKYDNVLSSCQKTNCINYFYCSLMYNCTKKSETYLISLWLVSTCTRLRGALTEYFLLTTQPSCVMREKTLMPSVCSTVSCNLKISTFPSSIYSPHEAFET